MNVTDNPTMELLEAAFNLLCHNSPQHHDCMSDQCDGCDWDALQLIISKHINGGESRSVDSPIIARRAIMFNDILPTWLVAFIIFCMLTAPIAAFYFAVKGIIWLCQHVRFV